MSVNRVVLLCNLGKDPELKQTQSGFSVCNISAATSRKYKDKDGQYQEETEWHSIVAYGKQADTLAKHLHKGSQIYIEGRLRTEKFTDKNGVEKYYTKIIVESFQFIGLKKQEQALAPDQEPPSTDEVPF